MGECGKPLNVQYTEGEGTSSMEHYRAVIPNYRATCASFSLCCEPVGGEKIWGASRGVSTEQCMASKREDDCLSIRNYQHC